MSSVCRGCAGYGVGQHVDPRTWQVIRDMQIFAWRMVSTEYDARGGRLKDRMLILDPATHRGRLVYQAPFASFLREYRERIAEGYVPHAKDITPDPAWACEWCHGTGVPQLSTATMRGVPCSTRSTSRPVSS